MFRLLILGSKIEPHGSLWQVCSCYSEAVISTAFRLRLFLSTGAHKTCSSPCACDPFIAVVFIDWVQGQLLEAEQQIQCLGSPEVYFTQCENTDTYTEHGTVGLDITLLILNSLNGWYVIEALTWGKLQVLRCGMFCWSVGCFPQSSPYHHIDFILITSIQIMASRNV